MPGMFGANPPIMLIAIGIVVLAIVVLRLDDCRLFSR